jgi:hypothetical protein
MTEEQAVRILTEMNSPVVGRYLAECVAYRLYQILSKLDKEGIDRLLAQATQSMEHTVSSG